MNRRNILILCLIIILIMATVVIVKEKNTNNKVQDGSVTKIESDFDKTTGLYYVKDEVTNEIIFASPDENDPNLKFYKDHSDFNPNPLEPRPTTLEEFVRYGDSEEDSDVE